MGGERLERLLWYSSRLRDLLVGIGEYDVPGHETGGGVVVVVDLAR
jgi:hypothetical protein